MDFGAALERMTSSPQYQRGLMSLAGLDPAQQAAAQVNQAQVDEYNRAQQEREALKQIDPAMIPDELRELWATSPELAMKMWPQLVKEVAPSSTIGKIQADIDAKLIDPTTGAAALKKETTIPPVYDPVTKQMIYAGGDGFTAPQGMGGAVTGGIEIPPEYANNPAAAQVYLEATASEAGKSKVAKEANAPIAIQKGLEALKIIDSTLESPGLEGSVGLKNSAYLFGLRDEPFAGTDEASFMALQKQLQGKTFLEAYETLKGGGQITEVEGKKAEMAIARLDTAQKESDYKAALMDLRDVVIDGLKRAGMKDEDIKSATGAKYQEGQTATGANGQKLVYTNGKWRAQ